MPSDKPAWLDRHPCAGCGTGYGECTQFARLSLMCCAQCKHPGRWTTNPPYSPEEYEEMNRG